MRIHFFNEQFTLVEYFDNLIKQSSIMYILSTNINWLVPRSLIYQRYGVSNMRVSGWICLWHPIFPYVSWNCFKQKTWQNLILFSCKLGWKLDDADIAFRGLLNSKVRRGKVSVSDKSPEERYGFKWNRLWEQKVTRKYQNVKKVV